MKNNINKIITLDNKDKYVVVDQGNYDGKPYYLLAKLDENGDLTGKVSVVEDNNGRIESVTEPDLLEALVKYFNERANKE